jgi:hypothetical protein
MIIKRRVYVSDLCAFTFLFVVVVDLKISNLILVFKDFKIVVPIIYLKLKNLLYFLRLK